MRRSFFSLISALKSAYHSSKSSAAAYPWGAYRSFGRFSVSVGFFGFLVGSRGGNPAFALISAQTWVSSALNLINSEMGMYFCLVWVGLADVLELGEVWELFVAGSRGVSLSAVSITR